MVPLTAQPGANTFAGFNVHSIVLQGPITKLTTDGQAAKADGSNSIIGVYATTSRQKQRVLSESGYGTAETGNWDQIERLGNPLVNEVVVPLGAKDHFNATPPTGDAEFLPAVQDPEVPKLMNLIYGISVPPAPRNDLVTIFLTGVPGLNQPPNVQASELLRLNMGIPASAPAGKGNRLGVLGGDNAGFPNGRRLEDDVIDISLRAMAGGTPCTPSFNVAPNNALTDGVDASAQPFNDAFPYLSEPYPGFGHAGGTAGSATGTAP